MSNRRLAQLSKVSAPSDPRHPCNEHFIYLLSKPGGPTKIGKAWSVGRRQAQLEMQYGQTLYLLGSWPVGQDVAYQVERYAHWLLRDKHYHNEWFNVSEDEAREAVEKALSGNYHPKYLIPTVYPVGKRSIYPEHVQARFERGTVDAIGACLDEGELMADFIRDAVRREIGRRSSLTPPSEPSTTAVSTGSPRRVDVSAGGSQRRQ